MAYSYVEGRADSNDNRHFGGEEDRYLPNNRIFAPKLQAYLAYEGVSAGLRLQAVRSGSRDRFEPNDLGNYGYGEGPLEAFTVLNLSGSYAATPQVKFTAGVENLLNQAYYTTISQWNARDDAYVMGNGMRLRLAVQVDL